MQTAAMQNLRFNQLGVAQGLPQETVNAVVQDGDGYLWFGTQTGIARWDGYTFTGFHNDPDNSASLDDNWIQSLYVDDHNRLWVGHRQGLDRYDPVNDTFVHYHLPSLGRNGSGDGVTVITGNTQRGLWMGSGDGLINLDLRSNRCIEYHHNPEDSGSLVSDQVIALAFHANGGLWIGTIEGLDYLAPQATQFIHYSVTESTSWDASSRAISGILVNRDGTLWVASHAGLQHWRPHPDGSVEPLAIPNGLTALMGVWVTALYRDRSGQIWIGTRANGLYHFDQKTGAVIHYQKKPANTGTLNDNYVTSINQDRDGTLWVGTYSGGANWVNLQSGGFEHYTDDGPLAPHLSGSHISSVSGDAQGGLWLAVREHGVDHVNLHTGQVYNLHHDPKRPDSLSNDNVSQAILDQYGRLWVATSHGLEVGDPVTQRFRRLAIAPGLGFNPPVYQLLADHDAIWVSTHTGLFQIDVKTKHVIAYHHHPTNPDSLSSDFVVATMRDQESLWVATFGGGLDRLELTTGRFIHHRHDQNPLSLTSDRVQALLKDHLGRLWVGTSSGLNLAQPQPDGTLRFTSYTRRNGMMADSIGGVLEDHHGRLWASTTSGISRLEPASGQIHNFTPRDRLGDGSYFIGSVYRALDGRLYFGGIDGLTVFDPDQVHSNSVTPQTRITDLKILNQSIHDYRPPGLEIHGSLLHLRRVVLPHTASMFTIEFSAMHSADPARNQYLYRLCGFDRNWIKASAAHRLATYTNLDPGHYEFQVRAANKDGVWQGRAESLAIDIIPPFWATWWFRMLAAVSVVSLATMLYRLRVARLTRQARELETHVAERTHELAVALERLELVSITDPLTGMYNRRFLVRQMEAEVSSCLCQRTAPAQTLLFFLLDVDHFKQLNDTFGHVAGDSLLRQILPRLNAVLRQGDYLVRWGGEEFLVVARGARVTQVTGLAERLCEEFRKPFELDTGRSWCGSCSVGGAGFPFHLGEPELLTWSDVIALADLGLYAAKRGGRNGWVVITAGDAQMPDDLGTRLRHNAHQLFRQDVLRMVTSLDQNHVARWIGRHDDG